MRVWVLSDGKAGHVSQTRGLAVALLEGCKDDGIVEVDVLKQGFRTVWRAWRKGEPPALILAAGHKTHIPLLFAGLLMRKARTVVCMKPSLPMGWFDVCVVPRHDVAKVSRHVITTVGALNGIRPHPEKAKDRGVILIGGPSKEYGWDEEALLKQLVRLAGTLALQSNVVECERPREPLRWVLTTSRRTPSGFVKRVPPGIDVVPVEETPRGWVAEQLMHAHTAWVTRDSVSMIYESLSSGAAVGLLDMPLIAPKMSRVRHGIAMLGEEGRVTSFAEWERTGKLKTAEPLVEVDRVAALIKERFEKNPQRG